MRSERASSCLHCNCGSSYEEFVSAAFSKINVFFFMCTIIRECYLSHSTVTVDGILEKKRVNSSSIVCLTYIVDGCFGQSPKARGHKKVRA